MADLEVRLNGILDLLSQRKPDTDSDNTATSPDLVHSKGTDPLIEEQEHETCRADDLHWGDGSNDNHPFTTHNATNARIVEEIPMPTGEIPSDVYTLGTTGIEISAAVLQHLLDTFDRMIPYFPFVQLPGNLTVAAMVAERPFLLLAIATAAAFNYPQLQRTLEAELKEMLSRQVIIDGERSLDILQGLLVHLAWYFIHPETATVSRLRISNDAD
jgi:hypothetical protein